MSGGATSGRTALHGRRSTSGAPDEALPELQTRYRARSCAAPRTWPRLRPSGITSGHRGALEDRPSELWPWPAGRRAPAWEAALPLRCRGGSPARPPRSQGRLASHSQPNGPRGSGRWHSRCPPAGLRPPQLAPAGRPPRAQLQTPLHHVAPHGPPWPCERPREAPSPHLDRLTSPCPLCATALDKATLLLVNGAAAAAQNVSHVLAPHHMSQAPSVHRSHYLFFFLPNFFAASACDTSRGIGRMAAGQRGGDTTTGCPCCSPRKRKKKSRGERRTLWQSARPGARSSAPRRFGQPRRYRWASPELKPHSVQVYGRSGAIELLIARRGRWTGSPRRQSGERNTCPWNA
ncbi:unnamed protein product [Urochloa humidicola]